MIFNTLFMIVGAVLLIGSVLFAFLKIFKQMGGQSKNEERLRTTGIPVRARIINIQMGSMSMQTGASRFLAVNLTVQLENNPVTPQLQQIMVNAMASELQIPILQPGAWATVRVDPTNGSNAILESVITPQGMSVPVGNSVAVPKGAKMGLWIGVGGAILGVGVAAVVVAVNVFGVGLNSASAKEGNSICARTIRCCELVRGADDSSCKNFNKIGVTEQICEPFLKANETFAAMKGLTCE
ncbi:MAG: hypothetical protein FWG75_03955 [Cystobacterineae bacterium]|nr:hypothetical protein [Cystobacterineae bacterium]